MKSSLHEGDTILKVVGKSGQLSLGKKLAGQYFEVEQRPDGSILLAPVTVSRKADKPGATKATPAARPRFHVFKVERFDLPHREEMHRRGAVR